MRKEIYFVLILMVMLILVSGTVFTINEDSFEDAPDNIGLADMEENKIYHCDGCTIDGNTYNGLVKKTPDGNLELDRPTTGNVNGVSVDGPAIIKPDVIELTDDSSTATLADGSSVGGPATITSGSNVQLTGASSSYTSPGGMNVIGKGTCAGESCDITDAAVNGIDVKSATGVAFTSDVLSGTAGDSCIAGGLGFDPGTPFSLSVSGDTTAVLTGNAIVQPGSTHTVTVAPGSGATVTYRTDINGDGALDNIKLTEGTLDPRTVPITFNGEVHIDLGRDGKTEMSVRSAGSIQLVSGDCTTIGGNCFSLNNNDDVDIQSDGAETLDAEVDINKEISPRLHSIDVNIDASDKVLLQEGGFAGSPGDAFTASLSYNIPEIDTKHIILESVDPGNVNVKIAGTADETDVLSIDDKSMECSICEPAAATPAPTATHFLSFTRKALSWVTGRVSGDLTCVSMGMAWIAENIGADFTDSDTINVAKNPPREPGSA